MSDDETIGGLYDRLPAEAWVDLPEYGVRVKRWAQPEPAPERQSTSAQLRQTQQDLAASQADLTTALAHGDRLRAEVAETQIRLGDRAEQLLAVQAELASARQELEQLRGKRPPIRLNGPMVARLRRCAADESSNWDGQITVYPPEARELVALIDRDPS